MWKWIKDALNEPIPIWVVIAIPFVANILQAVFK